MPSGMAVIVFLFAIVSCLPDSHDLAGRSQTAPGEKHKRDGRSVWHTGPGGAPAPEIDWSILHGKSQKLPYCPVDPVTADFLKKIRKDLGNQADSTLKHRASRGTKGLRSTFPIPNCHHAALNLNNKRYVQPVYECCSNCRDKFSLCLIRPNHTPYTTSILCATEAIHCVTTECLCKTGQVTPGASGPIDSAGSDCNERRDGSCIKRSCIPIFE